jgi:hypothetical protein
MKEIRETKRLKTQLRKLEEQIFDIHNVMSEYQRRYNGLKKDKTLLINKINDMNKGELRVTEHAIIRYFERVLGFNIEEIEENIILGVSEAQKELGNGTYPSENFKVVIKENTVVTIIS